MTQEDAFRQRQRDRLLKDIVVASLTHPLTLYPAVAGALAAVAMGLFGPSVPLFFGLLGATGVSASSAIVNFFFRGPKLAEKYVDRVKMAEEDRERARLTALRSRLLAGGAEDLAGRFDALQAAHDRFFEALERFGQHDPMTAADLEMQALDAYSSGIEALERLAIIAPELARIENQGLQMEEAALRFKIQEMAEKSQGHAGAALEALRANHRLVREKLQLLEETRSRVTALTHRADAARQHLETALLRMVKVLADEGEAVTSAFDLEGATEDLYRSLPRSSDESPPARPDADQA